jgi:transcriptional regulator with XRE-family HTH domain
MVKETLTEKTENSLSVKAADSNSDQFPARLREVIGTESQRSFADNIAVSEGTLRTWLSGKSEPGMHGLISIAKYRNISIDWLTMGKGEKFRDRHQDDSSISVTVTTNSEHPTRRKDINHGEPPAYEATPAQDRRAKGEPPLNTQVLLEVIETVESNPQSRGLALRPERKALLIQLLYEYQMDKRMNKDDSEKFIHLIDNLTHK